MFMTVLPMKHGNSTIFSVSHLLVSDGIGGGAGGAGKAIAPPPRHVLVPKILRAQRKIGLSIYSVS